MSKACIWIAGFLVLITVRSATAEISWYLGAGGAITSLESADFSDTSGLDSVPNAVVTISQEFDGGPFGWRIFAGVNFSENFGLTLKYSNSGNYEDDWLVFTRTDDDMDPMTPPVGTNYFLIGESSFDGYTVYAAPTIPLGERLAFTVQLGWTSQEIDFSWNSVGNSGSISRSDSGFACGALLRYKFLSHWAVSTEFEWLLIDFDNLINLPISFGINLEYHF